MKKFLSILFISFFAFVLLGIIPNQVYAQTCDPQSGCTLVNQPYCAWYDIIDPIYHTVTGQQWLCTDNWICQYNTPNGNCNCCFEGGCYFNCPSTIGNNPPPDPGGGGPTPTPVPPASLNAVALQILPNDTSCATVHNNAIGGVNATTFGFTASSVSQPPPQSQSGATPVIFANQPVGQYTLTASPPNANWVVANICLYDNGVLIGNGASIIANSGDTISWEIGYTYGTAWTQTQGGDVYASGQMRSFIPEVTPRVFNSDGSGGYPGIATYGTSYDFDSDVLSAGSTLISSTNWLANVTRPTVDYYSYFYHRFGSPIAADYTNPDPATTIPITQPPSRTLPYYVTGNMTTSGNWSVGTGESVVFLVNGDLTIGGRINITGTGFVAFIVSGNITVADTVGTTTSSTGSVVDGIYIVSPTGTFRTGGSIAPETAKFVGKGMFIAGNFLLERDLEAYGANTTDPAELFIYDPQLLITMPDSMKELPVVWQEVAP